jgi:hypothetical protein
MIVGSDNEVVKGLGDIASFSLSSMISPGIKPFLKLMRKGFTWLKAEVIKDNRFVMLITAPPLIILFEVGVRVFFPYGFGFACTSLSIMPLNVLRVSARRDFDMILLILTDISVVAKKDVRRDLFFFTFGSEI